MDRDEGTLGALRFMADMDKPFFCQMKQDKYLQDHLDQYMDGILPTPDLSGNNGLSSYIVMAKHFFRNRASFSFLHYDVGAGRLSQNTAPEHNHETLKSLVEDLNISLAFLHPFACDHKDMKIIEKKVHLCLQWADCPFLMAAGEAMCNSKEPTSVIWL